MIDQTSLAAIPEQALVRHIVAEPPYWNPFLALHGTPQGARCFLEMPQPEWMGRGDIDVLVVNPAQPELATAFQVKRVKISASTFDSGAPNGFGSLAKLHAQSHVLLRAGFWRVISVVLVVADCRSRNSDPHSINGLTPELRETIKSAISATLPTSSPSAPLGVLRFDYEQCHDDSLIHSGASCIEMLNPALEQPQTSQVTAWVTNTLVEIGCAAV